VELFFPEEMANAKSASYTKHLYIKILQFGYRYPRCLGCSWPSDNPVILLSYPDMHMDNYMISLKSCAEILESDSFDICSCVYLMMFIVFIDQCKFPVLSSFCIKFADDKMVELCSATTSTLTRENTTVYIWNTDFGNSSISPSDPSCNCSVEIDNCDANIDIYKMYRILTGNG
jgi:hypothetical protein